jgi:SAM-dependent methyltransferase
MPEEAITFSFGANWEEYIRLNFSDERVEIAKQHLLGFLELPDLRGKYFLDVGCGSGIHSLAAFKAGAARIVSFDIDPLSVKTAETLRARHGNPAHWEILHGSVLDASFLAKLTPAELVYSWGVLHHTGSMWPAIRNAAGLVAPQGLFYIALYTTDSKSAYWLNVKKKYNRASSAGKRWMEYAYILRRTILPQCLRFKNPLKTIREYQQSRGMSYLTDVKDWLGGYPFEHAKIEEVLQFFRQEMGGELLNIKTGEANTEYLFRLPQAPRRGAAVTPTSIPKA